MASELSKLDPQNPAQSEPAQRNSRLPLVVAISLSPILLYWIGASSEVGRLPFVGYLIYVVVSIIATYLAGTLAIVILRSSNKAGLGLIAGGAIAIFLATFALQLYFDYFSKVRQHAARDLVVQQAHKQIALVCENAQENQYFGGGIGSVPLKSRELVRVAASLEGPIKTIRDLHPHEFMTPKEKAELALASSILKLWHEGPIHPKCDDVESMNARFQTLATVYEELTTTGKDVKADHMYLVLLHCRYATVVVYCLSRIWKNASFGLA